MRFVALSMLMGDRTKFLGIVFGVAFATLLMSQQASLFCGVMGRTVSFYWDVQDARLWIADAQSRNLDEGLPLPENALQRVRGIPGVAWAVPHYQGRSWVRLADGRSSACFINAYDDASLVGMPRHWLVGDFEAIRGPDTVVISDIGYGILWPGQPFQAGHTLEINGQRAVIAGVCKASAPFGSLPVVYCRMSQARRYAPGGEQPRLANFLLAQPDAHADEHEVCRRITEETGLLALTREQVIDTTINFYLNNTAIPVNFGITVMLGFIVGVAIAGQTFYLFTLENLKQFGSLKAMGLSNPRIVGMILTQAVVVGLIGYGIGMGLAAAFFEATRDLSFLTGYRISWQVAVGTFGAVLTIMVLASFVSIRRVLVLEPAVVFR